MLLIAGDRDRLLEVVSYLTKIFSPKFVSLSLFNIVMPPNESLFDFLKEIILLTVFYLPLNLNLFYK